MAIFVRVFFFFFGGGGGKKSTEILANKNIEN